MEKIRVIVKTARMYESIDGTDYDTQTILTERILLRQFVYSWRSSDLSSSYPKMQMDAGDVQLVAYIDFDNELDAIQFKLTHL